VPATLGHAAVSTTHPPHYCNGGIRRGHWLGCGDVATVVCTERDAILPLQWFACDKAEHQAGGTAEPIASWFARIYAAADAKRARHG
jgi:hypothetical protein